MSKGKRSIGGEQLVRVLKELATPPMFPPGWAVVVERAEDSDHVEVCARMRIAEERHSFVVSCMVSDPTEVEGGGDWRVEIVERLDGYVKDLAAKAYEMDTRAYEIGRGRG